MAPNKDAEQPAIAAFSEATIERILTLVSHELRTPITSIRVAIELLQGYNLEDLTEIESLLLLAASNTDRLTQVIDTILDWSQIAYEAAPLLKQPCYGEHILQQVVVKLTPFSTEQQVAIQLETASRLPLVADRYFLGRAFQYVVHNAVKFSPQGSQIYITTTVAGTGASPEGHRTPLPSPYGLITIQDHGIGIPEAYLEKIFLPFLQVDSSDSRPHVGLGLELATCRQVIQRHGGSIWAESTVGRGSTFYIALPLLNGNCPDLRPTFS
jgi:signal transduction histidine kinase